MQSIPVLSRLLPLLVLLACGSPAEAPEPDSLGVDKAKRDARVRPSIYVPVQLTADLSALSQEDRQMLPLLFDAARITDTLYWLEGCGAPDSIPMRHPHADLRNLFRMNYGTWDRLNG